MGLFDNGYISWLIIPIAMVYGCIYPQNWLIIFFLVKIERFDCGQARSHRFSSVGRCLGWERYRWYQLDNYQFSLAYPTDIQSRPILAYLSIFDFNFDGPIQVAILESSQDQFESSEQIFPYISTYFHIFPHISIYFHIFPYIYPHMSIYVHILYVHTCQALSFCDLDLCWLGGACLSFLRCRQCRQWNIPCGEANNHNMVSLSDPDFPSDAHNGDLPSGNGWHSYWKWPFIVDFPIKNGDFP
jgi:hypothetical protein